jgi:hypothetical protein
VTASTLFARQADKRMGEDVRANLLRLFNERSAQILENGALEYNAPRYFDYAVATVGTPDLDLRVIRVRGDFSIDISIPGHRRWDALVSALLWLDMQSGVKTKSEIPNWTYGFDWASLDWWSIDQFLCENWDRLKAAAGARPYLDPR